MIVVDTNVIAYLWLPGARTAAAERLVKKDSDWNAPLLWRSEFRNVLAGCLRRGRPQAGDGAPDHEWDRGADARPGVLRPLRAGACPRRRVGLLRVRLRVRRSRPEFGVALVTSDEKLLKTFPSVARSLS